MLKVDCSKFYWALRIRRQDHPKFAFMFEDCLFQWRAMRFGFVNAMQLLHRIMAPVIAKLTMMGITTHKWVNDIIIVLGEEQEKARALVKAAINLLVDLGFFINLEKSLP